MSSLDNRRTWIVGGVVIALLLGVASWFLLISPKFQSADAHRADAADTRQTNAELAAIVKSLHDQATHISTYTGELRTALAALPLDSGLPAFTRQLAKQAVTTHVGVSSIVVGAITPILATTAGTTTPTTDGSTDSSSDTSETTPSTTPTGGATPGAIYSVEVTVQTIGSYADQIAFVRSVQTAGPRRALVTSSSIGPAGSAVGTSLDKTSSQTLVLDVFSTPQTPDQIALFQKLLAGKVKN